MSEIDIEDYDDEIEVVLSESVSFIELIDTPTTYTGQANKILQVKTDETGVEFTDAPTVVDWDEIGGDQTDISLSGFTNDFTTTDIPEGDNLYYTDTRVRAALSSSDPITYNSETGDFGLAYNTTNLKITETELNTIQNINTTATPQFTGVKVDKIQAITDSSSAIIIEDAIGTDIITIDTVTPATNVYSNLNIYGDITQNGSAYETHAEQIYTKDDLIITRDGAVAGLNVGEYSGIQAHLYDGVNDGQLVFDKDGWARVGDVGDLQKLATIEETSQNGGVAFYDTTDFQLKTDTNLTWDNVNNRLGVGISIPLYSIHTNGDVYLNERILFSGTNAYPRIRRNSNDLIIDTNTLASAITFKDGGKVGIGTTSPDSLLHINSSTNAIFTLQSTQTANSELNITAGANNIDYKTIGINDVMSFSTYYGEKMRITPEGNVGIGTTSPGAKLEVNGGDIYIWNNGGNPRFLVGDAAGSGNYGGFRWDSISDLIQIGTDAGGYVLNLDEAGNVGIGTKSPAGQLHVYNNTADATTTLTVDKHNASATGNIVDFQFGGTTRAWITSTGTIATNVGITNLSGGAANSAIYTASTGTTISRNVADSNSALIVNQANASSTGWLQSWQFNGTNKAYITTSGTFYGAGFSNFTSTNNGAVILNTTGVTIQRNVADTNPSLIINQIHASSTGDIIKAQSQSVDRFNVAYDGTTTLSNDKWLRATDYAGTGVVNMFKVNASNEIDVGGTLNIGTLSLSEDSGLTSMINLPVSATPSDGTQEAYTFNIDSDVVLKVHALADGSGGVDNKAVIIATEDLEVPDTSLSNGQTTFYLDETSNTLTVKCKYSDGTVKTGTIALT